MTRRDRARERAWLDLAERAAGPSGFVEHARRRLEMGERCYGDHWARFGLPVLLRELAEEAADLGAWSALAAQALDGAPLHHGGREAVAGLLADAAEHGARAHAAIAAPQRIAQGEAT